MTVIPPESAEERLAPGDIYTVEGYGPYLVVLLDDKTADEMFGGHSHGYSKKHMSVLLHGKYKGSHDFGDVVRIGLSGCEKLKADEVRLVPSRVVDVAAVPPGRLFVSRPNRSEREGEDVFVMIRRGKCFRADGTELGEGFKGDEKAEIMTLVTDLPESE